MRNVSDRNNKPVTLPSDRIRESIAQQERIDRKIFQKHQQDIAKQDDLPAELGGSGE